MVPNFSKNHPIWSKIISLGFWDIENTFSYDFEPFPDDLFQVLKMDWKFSGRYNSSSIPFCPRCCFTIFSRCHQFFLSRQKSLHWFWIWKQFFVFCTVYNFLTTIYFFTNVYFRERSFNTSESDPPRGGGGVRQNQKKREKCQKNPGVRKKLKNSNYFWKNQKSFWSIKNDWERKNWLETT